MTKISRRQKDTVFVRMNKLWEIMSYKIFKYFKDANSVKNLVKVFDKLKSVICIDRRRGYYYSCKIRRYLNNLVRLDIIICSDKEKFV